MRQQKREFSATVDRLRARLRQRRLFLNPFKLDPIKHMQRYALSDQEWAALRFLRANPLVKDILKDAGWVTVDSKSLEGMPFKSFRVDPNTTSEKEIVLVKVDIDWNNLPDTVRDYIVRWADYDFALRESSFRALTHFTGAGERVRTWGQLYRLWPGLLPLFPGEMKHLIMNKRAQSKIPVDILLNDDGVRHDMFLAENVEASDMVFAEMMLIPQDVSLDWPEPEIRYLNERYYHGL